MEIIVQFPQFYSATNIVAVGSWAVQRRHHRLLHVARLTGRIARSNLIKQSIAFIVLKFCCSLINNKLIYFIFKFGGFRVLGSSTIREQNQKN
jgi:hypothetical protein